MVNAFDTGSLPVPILAKRKNVVETIRLHPVPVSKRVPICKRVGQNGKEVKMGLSKELGAPKANGTCHTCSKPLTKPTALWCNAECRNKYYNVPSMEQLTEWMMDGVCEATDGCMVEPDGKCEHGKSSWLLILGMI
jgi:hypothetical protein